MKGIPKGIQQDWQRDKQKNSQWKENLVMLVCCMGIFCLLQIYDNEAVQTSAREHRPQKTTLEKTDFIRFHVIANSNTERDQGLKIKVKDQLVERINKNLMNFTTIQESRAYIKENIPMLERMAEEIIAEQGYDYSVKAWLGNRFIPEKTYGSITFPPGQYEALNIEIGKAQGENWWCVLYPPLCLIDSSQDTKDSKQAKERELAEQNILKNKKYDEITKSKQTGTPLKLKFKTAEIFEAKAAKTAKAPEKKGEK